MCHVLSHRRCHSHRRRDHHRSHCHHDHVAYHCRRHHHHVIVVVIVIVMVVSWSWSWSWLCPWYVVSVTWVCDPSRVPIWNTAPKTSVHPKVSPVVFTWTLRGSLRVRYGPGSHEATPRIISGELGHPALTRTIPSPLDHYLSTTLSWMVVVVSVLTSPSTFTPLRLAVGRAACLCRISRRRLGGGSLIIFVGPADH